MKTQGNLGSSQNFIKLTNDLRAGIPKTFFTGIIISYIINAVMIGLFLFPTVKKVVGMEGAVFICIFGSVVVQLFRYLIVFTDLLYAEGGQNSKLQVKAVAAAMAIIGIIELCHLASTFEITFAEMISICIFGSSIIAGGWLLEINFIKKTNEFIYQDQEFPQVGKIGNTNVHVGSDSLNEMLRQIIQENYPALLQENATKKTGPKDKSLKKSTSSRYQNPKSKFFGWTSAEIIAFLEHEEQKSLKKQDTGKKQEALDLTQVNGN